jgi:hypothetical protein
MYLRTKRAFILEHYFASKPFAAAREEFSSAFPDTEVPKTARQPGTKYGNTGSICL